MEMLLLTNGFMKQLFRGNLMKNREVVIDIWISESWGIQGKLVDKRRNRNNEKNQFPPSDLWGQLTYFKD